MCIYVLHICACARVCKRVCACVCVRVDGVTHGILRYIWHAGLRAIPASRRCRSRSATAETCKNCAPPHHPSVLQRLRRVHASVTTPAFALVVHACMRWVCRVQSCEHAHRHVHSCARTRKSVAGLRTGVWCPPAFRREPSLHPHPPHATTYAVTVESMALQASRQHANQGATGHAGQLHSAAFAVRRLTIE